ncbi:MAG: hypothetical protein H6706_21485 [Myxococcales bacterium]|nr:hypothetical protein [Myxococcales bacterium]
MKWRPPPPPGFLAALVATLEHPLMTVAMLGCLAVAMVLGLGASPGDHPLMGPWAQVALVLAAFSLLAQALRGRPAVPTILWAGGLGLAAIGAPLAGGGLGTVTLGAAPPEAYDQGAGERPLATHLGGPLYSAIEGDAVDLRLAVKDAELGAARLPLDGSAGGPVGPRWRMRVEQRGVAGAPTHIRLKVRARAGDGEAQTLRLAAGQATQVTTAAGVVRLDVRQISPDFGRALGPAAWLVQSWPGADGKPASESAWHFVQGADLDARLGAGPLVIELLGVEAEASPRLLVARQGQPLVLMAGLGLMILGLLAATLRRTA